MGQICILGLSKNKMEAVSCLTFFVSNMLESRSRVGSLESTGAFVPVYKETSELNEKLDNQSYFCTLSYCLLLYYITFEFQVLFYLEIFPQHLEWKY